MRQALILPEPFLTSHLTPHSRIEKGVVVGESGTAVDSQSDGGAVVDLVQKTLQ